MSKTVRQSAFSGLLGSKRFIVAVCAAIAMVLGAMSVGASVFVPSAPDETQQASHFPIFSDQNGADKPDASKESGRFTSQERMDSHSLFGVPQTGTAASSSRPKGSLGIEFGPVNTSVGLTLGQLQLKIDTPSATVDISVPDSPIQTPIIETTQPSEEPSEEPPAAPSGDSSVETVAPMSVFSTSQNDAAASETL